jgi:hypothetical protein
METKSLWLALALLGSSGLAACEEKSPVEDAVEDIGDKAEDAVDKAN